MKKNVILNCIKDTFNELKRSIYLEKVHNFENKEVQKMLKYELADFINQYKKLGGKRNIQKYCELI